MQASVLGLVSREDLAEILKGALKRKVGRNRE
jgi:hypothetical protein